MFNIPDCSKRHRLRIKLFYWAIAIFQALNINSTSYFMTPQARGKVRKICQASIFEVTQRSLALVAIIIERAPFNFYGIFYELVGLHSRILL